MAKIAVLLVAAVSLVLVACGGGAEGEAGERAPALATMPTPAPAATPMLASAAAIAVEESDTSRVAALEAVQRQVISVASVSLEVEVVQAAVAEVRVIAEGLGGFVEQLSSSGGADRQQATMSIRVPQDQFFTALDRIKTLGEVQSENVGSEDVTERFIDLKARLNSSLREEQSFLSLLEKTETVSEIVTIERELFRVRSGIERLQGQLNFLERRVALSTITVSLSTPEAKIAQPPSASLTVEASDVTGSVEEIKALVAILEGVLDGVFMSVRDGREKAEMSLRVFSADFDRALASIEDLGEVRSKELRESTSPAEGESEPAEEPDALIMVSLIEKADSSSTGLIVAIVAPIGGVGLAVLLGILFYLAFRLGRRQGREA